MEREIKVLSGYVLVKQTMISKSSKIILDRAESNADKFNYTFEVVQIAKKYEGEIKVGDSPIFSEYVKFQGMKILEKTPLKMVSLVIVHEGDIIALEGDEVPIEAELN